MKEQKLDHQQELIKQIEQLIFSLERSNKFSRRFLLGIFLGLGTALGASVVATIVFLLLSQIIQASGLEVILGNELYQRLIESSTSL
ncbi:TPA: hypothetical protein DDZ01_02455 [Candidatus Uhrbacteria bacterium]|nr:MAG: hypothetical protein UT94_C0061G0005 [Candidatus Uhrbacteria bacterium GW2011_GWF2_40_263]HBK34831.1 hypothetical protein [Candidatus Uhrbacteria bacterium]HCB56221.1 hypothetical protein [Candidatus Uhrbacteria bacterium]